MTSLNNPDPDIVYGYIVARWRKNMTRDELDLAKRCINGDDVSDEWPITLADVEAKVDEAYAAIYAGQKAFSDLGSDQILS